MDSERDKMTRTAHKKIFVANVDRVDDVQFVRMMERLEAAAEHNDESAVEAVAEVVPTYHPWKDKKETGEKKAAV